METVNDDGGGEAPRGLGAGCPQAVHVAVAVDGAVIRGLIAGPAALEGMGLARDFAAEHRLALGLFAEWRWARARDGVGLEAWCARANGSLSEGERALKRCREKEDLGGLGARVTPDVAFALAWQAARLERGLGFVLSIEDYRLIVAGGWPLEWIAAYLDDPADERAKEKRRPLRLMDGWALKNNKKLHQGHPAPGPGLLRPWGDAKYVRGALEYAGGAVGVDWAGWCGLMVPAGPTQDRAAVKLPWWDAAAARADRAIAGFLDMLGAKLITRELEIHWGEWGRMIKTNDEPMNIEGSTDEGKTVRAG